MKKILLNALLIFFVIQYSQGKERIVKSINSAWKFKKGDIELKNPDFNDPSWEIVNIPHTWNANDVNDEKDGYYRGICWYNRTFIAEPWYKNKKVFLYVGAANQVAEVYVNGSKAGKHIGGYTAFCFDITNFLLTDEKKGIQNEIAIKVDNSHNNNIIPLSADFTFYGGIYRDVKMIVTDLVHFDLLDYASSGVFVETPEVKRENAKIKITTLVKNETASEMEVMVRSNIFDAVGNLIAVVENQEKTASGANQSIVQEIKNFPNPKLWSIDDPYLYKVQTQLINLKTKEVMDEIITPLGFRYFMFDANRGFYLNDKKIKLIGANRHQDYPGRGNALPHNFHVRDVELLKEMGGNYLRTSHYTHDPAIIEACDRLGIIVSTEIPLVNQVTESDAFDAVTKDMFVEMIHQYRNHPSILIWCMMNELLLRGPLKNSKDITKLTDEEKKYLSHVTNLSQELQNIAKKEDPARYTMFVHHGNFDIYHFAKLTKIPDLVGWNLYFGWYHGDFTGFDKFMQRHKDSLPNKPMLITEYGAGSDPRIRGFDTTTRFDFTVEYQVNLHDYYYQAIKKTEYCAGGAAWCFLDFNSEGRIDAVPHINNKGLLALDRKPKDTYYYYKANLTTEPFVKIAPTITDYRSGIQDNPLSNTSTQKVWIYSNMEKVELLYNRKSLDKVTPVNGVAEFEVPFHHGINQLEALGVTEGKLIKDYTLVNFEIQPIDFGAKTFPFTEIRINVGSLFHFTDNNFQVWLPDQEYKPGSYGYIGGETFMRWERSTIGSNKDIFGTEDDPIYQTQREGILSYKIDLPKGQYEVTMKFAELLSDSEKEKLAYNLGADNEKEKATERSFNVKINGELVLSNFNLAKQYAPERAVDETFIIDITDDRGLSIDFSKIAGQPILNGLRIRKIY